MALCFRGDGAGGYFCCGADTISAFPDLETVCAGGETGFGLGLGLGVGLGADVGFATGRVLVSTALFKK